MRSVVDLPAPFGPRKPVTRPAATSNDMSETACTLPKRLLSPSISIAVAVRHERGKLPDASGRRLSPPSTG